MDSQSIISAIGAEIAMLQQARSLLANGGKVNSVTTRKTAKVSAGQGTKRVISPEARKRIGNAQRERWAATKVNEATPPKATKRAAKKASPVRARKASPKKVLKRTMSPEARARIAEGQRKRWAAAKKLKSAASMKATKKASPVKAAKAAPAVGMPEPPMAKATS